MKPTVVRGRGVSWRDRARPVVSEAIRTGREKGLEGKDLKGWVHGAYPFGERAMHPYKVWCDEVKKQLGERRASDEDLSNYWHKLAYGGSESCTPG